MTASCLHRTSLTAALLLALAATALAQLPGGTIHLYTDPAFTDTTATDDSAGTLSIYVVWRGGPPDAVAWWLKITESPGFTGAWTGDTPHTGGFFGDTRTGIHLVEVSCLPDPAHVVTVVYQTFGTSAPCQTISVTAAGAAGIRINSCDAQGLPANGSTLVVNPLGCPVPIEKTTWGAVKALYEVSQ